MSQFIRFGKASGASRVLRPVGTERLTANEKAMSEKIISGISELASKVDKPAFARAIASGNVGAAVQSYNWGDFGTRMSETRLDLLQQLRQTGTAELRSLEGVIGTIAFDTTDVRATVWAAGRAGELVVQTSDQIRQQVREAVTNAFVQGLDGREVEKQLARQIGLFPRWASAVDKQYYTNLAVFQEQGLSFREAADKAQGLADKYRDRLIEARANNIARTEIVTASNQGRYISWLQAADAGLIDPAIAVKEWIAEADACPDCEAADGETVGLEEDFSTDESMPPAHPSCRCSAVIIPEGDGTVREVPEKDQTLPAMSSEEVLSQPEDSDILSSYAPAEGMDIEQFQRSVIEDPESYRNRYDLDTTRKDDREATVMDFQFPNAEARLDSLLGFDGLPSTVSPERFDELVSQGAEPIYRGLESATTLVDGKRELLPVSDAERMVSEFISGDHYNGAGIYGNGSYFSNNLDTAMVYSHQEPTAIISAVMHPEAKIIADVDLKQIIADRMSTLDERLAGKMSRIERMDLTNEQKLFSDPGRVARMLGFDGIRVTPDPLKQNFTLAPNEAFVVVLNRTATIVRA